MACAHALKRAFKSACNTPGLPTPPGGRSQKDADSPARRLAIAVSTPLNEKEADGKATGERGAATKPLT